MNFNKYRIIGPCPFGARQVDAAGRMDASQFVSSKPEDYIDSHSGGALAVRVAQQYGGQPVCNIETGFGTIDVWKVGSFFGAVYHYADDWYTTSNVLWRNTVNPVAIIKHAWQSRPGAAPALPVDFTVRDLCEAAGLSQRELAERFGIPRRTVEDWCRGIATPANYTRLMMAELLGLVER